MTIYALPPATPMISALAEMLMNSRAPLEDWQLYLPNRRACRALRDMFLSLGEGKPLLMPGLTPVGEEDITAGLQGDRPIPPAIHPMERQLVLGRMILANNPDWDMGRALSLAADLGQLIDRAHRESVPFEALTELVSEDYARHWQLTLDFLQAVMVTIWPSYLAERNCVDAALHKRLVIESLGETLRDDPNTPPILMAGVTLATPDMRDLAKIIAGKENGVLVLDGLNPDIDTDDLIHIGATHPNAVTLDFLRDMDVMPADIPPLPGTQIGDKDHIITSWMRPAETTTRWRQTPLAPQALEGISLCQCHDREEEALTIAVALREVLDTPGKTAALVTPDRMLAARVCSVMHRWGVVLDDSGGEPLHATPLGAWALAVLDAVSTPTAPRAACLRLVKSAYAAGGTDWPTDTPFRDTVRAMELAWRRKPDKPLPDPLHHAYETLQAQLAPLNGDHRNLQGWVTAHITVMEKLAGLPGDDPSSGARRLWLGMAGEELAALLRDLLAYQDLAGDGISLSDYRSCLAHFMARKTVRPLYGTHPRLSVLGLIESRSVTPDRVILGGLNEGEWPALPPHDRWMSEAMRKQAGFSPTAQLTGQAAHDFITRLSAPEIIMTRAARVDGNPTLPARWISRLATWMEAQGQNLSCLEDKGSALITLARHYEETHPDSLAMTAAEQPRPTPDPALFPDTIPVTKIDLLAKDPYSFYAQRILNLWRLDPIDRDSDAREKGTLWHKILEDFIRDYPSGALPDDAADHLHHLADQAMNRDDVPPVIRVLWRRRFHMIIPDFIRLEQQRRDRLQQAFVELEGRIPLIPGISLRGRADRIDRLRDGSYAVIDYKTGQPPSKTDIRELRQTQLTLEAAILSHGGFTDIQGQTSQLTYWQAGSQVKLSTIDTDVPELVDAAFERVKQLVASYAKGGRPYLSCPYGQEHLLPASADYVHLARLWEWSGTTKEAA